MGWFLLWLLLTAAVGFLAYGKGLADADDEKPFKAAAYYRDLDKLLRYAKAESKHLKAIRERIKKTVKRSR